MYQASARNECKFIKWGGKNGQMPLEQVRQELCKLHVSQIFMHPKFCFSCNNNKMYHFIALLNSTAEQW
jgi:hypothetical protein